MEKKLIITCRVNEYTSRAENPHGAGNRYARRDPGVAGRPWTLMLVTLF